MKLIRVICVVLTVAWTIGGVVAFFDPQIKSDQAKLAVLITMTGCWLGIGSWKYIWKEK